MNLHPFTSGISQDTLDRLSDGADYRAADNYAYNSLVSQFLPFISDPAVALNPGIPSDFNAFNASIAPPASDFGLFDDIPGSRDHQNPSFSFVDTFTPTPTFGQNALFSPYGSSCSSSPAHYESPVTVSPRDIQDSSYAYSTPPGINFNRINLSYSFSDSFQTSHSAITPIKSEPSPQDNALRLFTPSQDGSAYTFPQFQPGCDLMFPQDTSFPASDPKYSFDKSVLFSSNIDSASQFFPGGLPSPPENCHESFGHKRGDVSNNDPTSYSVSTEAFQEDALIVAQLAQFPDFTYPSPNPTPNRPATSFPHRSRATETPDSTATRPKRRTLPVRAAASKCKSYTEPSEGLDPASAADECNSDADPASHSTRSRSESRGLTPEVDEGEYCKFGKKVWVLDDEKGTHIPKWKCSKCGAIMGRRPDLHRHYKSCTMKEKHHCVAIHHEDGTVWPGCGMTFSRRDACHRHLKRRLTEGRCSKTRPRIEMYKTTSEYEEKIQCFREMLKNSKWRAALPVEEKNRLAKEALPDIKQEIFVSSDDNSVPSSPN